MAREEKSSRAAKIQRLYIRGARQEKSSRVAKIQRLYIRGGKGVGAIKDGQNPTALRHSTDLNDTKVPVGVLKGHQKEPLGNLVHATPAYAN
jgi:hypothetical protein